MTALGGAAVLVAFVLLGLLGNSAISPSRSRRIGGHYSRAASQAKRAMHFVPWSAEPCGGSVRPRHSPGTWRPRARATVERSRRIQATGRSWYELAGASSGAARARALAQASRPTHAVRRSTESERRKGADEPLLVLLPRPARKPRRADPPRLRLRCVPPRRRARRRGRDQRVFERALRYRHGYDRSKGEPVAWLLGIARRCTNAALAARAQDERRVELDVESASFEDDSIRRLTLAAALSQLSDRDQELISLRFGADLTAAQIAHVLDAKTNTVEVALHRALGRLRSILESESENGATLRPGVRVSQPAAVSAYRTAIQERGFDEARQVRSRERASRRPLAASRRVRARAHRRGSEQPCDPALAARPAGLALALRA